MKVSVLYIKEQGAYVKKRSKRIVVEKNSKTILEIPFMKVDSIVVFGNIQITTQLMRDLFERGIDITYMTRYGRYIGSGKSAVSKNIFLKLAQYDRYKDENYRLKTMKKIIKTKASNQISMIRKFNWKNSNIDFKENIKRMEDISKKIDGKNSRSGLMGSEGAISAEYFRVFKYMLKGNMNFEKRTRRPARDEINALLNLGYTFLTNEISSLLEASSFEVCLGFFHGVQYGRKSLALDIVEEFRQPVTDNFVLNIVNKGIVTEHDFESSDEGVFLTEESFGKFCIEYRKYLEGNIRNDITFSELFKRQVNNLRKAIMNGKIYNPYRMVL
jgi:CRISPR-associated protein Cas1